MGGKIVANESPYVQLASYIIFPFAIIANVGHNLYSECYSKVDAF